MGAVGSWTPVHLRGWRCRGERVECVCWSALVASSSVGVPANGDCRGEARVRREAQRVECALLPRRVGCANGERAATRMKEGRRSGVASAAP